MKTELVVVQSLLLYIALMLWFPTVVDGLICFTGGYCATDSDCVPGTYCGSKLFSNGIVTYSQCVDKVANNASCIAPYIVCGGKDFPIVFLIWKFC